MISVKDVTFQYKNSDASALKSVSLDIADGDFVGIIGTSGAGKTTLAFALNGIIPHEYKGDFYGSVTINGEDTVNVPPENFCRTVGEVFQDIDSQMVASVVEDEILFGLENFGVPHEEIEGRLTRVLRELGIEELRLREIASLSGGQKQKVAIASILALEPEIIVLDEPTGELDPESSRDIFGLLKKLNEEKNITVVIVEQKIMLLCEYVKRLVVLDKGQLKFNGTPRDVISSAKVFRELGINIPRVSELAVRLKADGLYGGEICLTVEEAQKMVEEVSTDEHREDVEEVSADELREDVEEVSADARRKGGKGASGSSGCECAKRNRNRHASAKKPDDSRKKLAKKPDTKEPTAGGAGR